MIISRIEAKPFVITNLIPDCSIADFHDRQQNIPNHIELTEFTISNTFMNPY